MTLVMACNAWSEHAARMVARRRNTACPQCGCPIDSSVEYCPFCGTKNSASPPLCCPKEGINVASD